MAGFLNAKSNTEKEKLIPELESVGDKKKKLHRGGWTKWLSYGI